MKMWLALVLAVLGVGVGYLVFETYGERFGLKNVCGTEGRECVCQGWMKKGESSNICYGFCGECKCVDEAGVEKGCE